MAENETILPFGEGFYVTIVFMACFMIIAVTAMVTEGDVAKALATGFTGIIGSIAAFWFATRGQTSGG